jgi:competence protein ComEA
MSREQDQREASPRVHEGGVSLSPTRGRSAAPHLSTYVAIWLPIAAKVAAAAIGAAVLAFIGAKSGAHAPPRTVAPEPSASAAPVPVVAAAFLVGLATTSPADDAGDRQPAAHLTEAEVAVTPVEGGATGLLADGRIVLNEATENELTKLPGIGPSRARAILALRQRLTRFKAVEDLLRVKGIGRKMLRRLRPSLVLDRPAASPRAVHGAVGSSAETQTAPPPAARDAPSDSLAAE